MKTFIVGNWKLNFTVGESSIYLHKILKTIPPHRDIEVIVAPSTIALQPLSLQIDRHQLKLAAQNAFFEDYGSYSGETSFSQLRGITDYCLIGTPERRHLFHEPDKMIKAKVAAAIRSRITPILCIGETEAERSFGEAADVLRDQLLGGLSDVSEEDLSKVIIVYEPIWAISTTRASHLATPDEVAEAIQLIRTTLKETYSKKFAESIPVLFGGGITPASAGAYLTTPGVNGLLLGRSSLILDEFADIIKTAKRIQS